MLNWVLITSAYVNKQILEGGTAGALTKITGALGKGAAMLTMDDKYQQKRTEKQNKHQGGGVAGKFVRSGVTLFSVWYYLICVLQMIIFGVNVFNNFSYFLS